MNDSYDRITSDRLAAADKLLSYSPNNEKMLRLHKSDSKTRLMLGGKRSGKSTFGVVECCWAALGIHPFISFPKPPLKIRICSVDFTSGIKGIILPMLYAWLPKPAIRRFWAEDRILELTNGTQIDLKSYDQDLEKFEGVERHLVWMDEEPPKAIYQSNYMRTISGGINGKLLITCTPLHGLTWLYDDLYDSPLAKPPYVDFEHVSILENPHLQKDAIMGILHDPAMKDNIDAAVYGQFVPKSGLVYKMFNPDIHVIDQLKGIPSDLMIVLGLDPHDRNPHGVLFGGLNKDNTWVIFDEIYEACIIDDLVKGIKAKLPGRWPPQLVIMDTSGYAPQSIAGRSIADELKKPKYGLYVIPAHKDVQAGRLKISGMLDPGTGKRPQIFMTRNCTNLVREFRHYVWDEWARKRDKSNPKEKPLKKDDHLLDALRYMVMADVVYRHPGFKLEKKYPETISQTGYYMRSGKNGRQSQQSGST